MNRQLRRQHVIGAIQMRLEFDPLFADFAQFPETEDLKTATVGQNRTCPSS